MNTEQNITLSKLMCDNTEGDGKAEAVMDYVISWTLRNAVDSRIENKTLHKYCKYILCKLLNVEASVSIETVKAWKQWNRIDLCVEIQLSDRGINRDYALLIENKYYTLIKWKDKQSQLEIYQAKFDGFYKDEKWIKKYALITCHEKETAKELYKEALLRSPKFNLFCWSDLIDKWNEWGYTGSEIFDEFWLKDW